jgi:hypothetical protein
MRLIVHEARIKFITKTLNVNIIYHKEAVEFFQKRNIKGHLDINFIFLYTSIANNSGRAV